MSILHSAVEVFLPYLISFFEIIGIIVVTSSGFRVFWQYFQNTFMRKSFDLQTNLAAGLAVGLEFKMAAEILKTVLIQTFDEIYMLGAVVLLRAILSLLIHFELGLNKKEKRRVNSDSEKDPENK